MCETVEGSAEVWLEYFHLFRYSRNVKGRQMYVPSPAGIQIRCLHVRWLESVGFNRKFIVNVMEHDNPTIERVKQMVLRHGPEETFRRCLPFLENTEYG